MAGIKLNARVKGSTILEVIVSMVVIVVVFGIAMMIYTNVLRTSVSVKKIRAQAILSQTMLKAENNPESIAQSLTIDDFRVEQEVKPYGDNNSLTEIH